MTRHITAEKTFTQLFFLVTKDCSTAVLKLKKPVHVACAHESDQLNRCVAGRNTVRYRAATPREASPAPPV